jgi:hypothetical protein
LEEAASKVGVMVAISAVASVDAGVSVTNGVSVAVEVGRSVGAGVADGVSGAGVSLGMEVAVENIKGVEDGRTIGRIVGINPMQAAKITPIAPINATIINAAVFFSVI